MTTRRTFIESLGGAATVAAFGAPSILRRRPSDAGLDLLILGGTGFIGPHLVRLALSRGHRVTTFTRGRHAADLPPGVTRLTGDRNGKLEALQGGRWDAVIDDSATNPDWVRQSTALLKGAVGRYLFTSSTGVYYPYLSRGLDETHPVGMEVTDPKDLSEGYAVDKARCERLTQDAFGDRGLVVRPTYIVGPGDTTDRFPYWPVRLARGGDTLAPGHQDDPVQIIDVRDLTAFMLALIESGQGGAFNAAGPAEPMTISGFLAAAVRILGSSSTLTWVDDYAFLEQQGITDSIPWVMLKGKDLGHTSIRNDKARKAGLRFRQLADTVRDTLAWWPSVPEARRTAPRFTITPEIEARALAAWRARSGR